MSEPRTPMVDFIIVGRGLAANVLMHSFYRNNISFVTIGDETLSSCSRVAAGIWNPVIFKRMNASWLAAETITELMLFYPACEEALQVKLITLRQIVKPFTEEQEKELWMKKAHGDLEPFLVETPQQNLAGLEGLKVPNGYGLVESGGNLDVKTFIDQTSAYFRDRIRDAKFIHQELEIFDDHVRYGKVEARNIIFCEGHLVRQNPYFSWLPMSPAKGELLTISSDEIHLKHRVFSRDGFLMDINDQQFRLGATFEWDDLTEKPTAKGLKELEKKMKRMSSKPFKVIRHEAGVRPSSDDRRPLIGRHPKHSCLYVFNGLGARGVMLAPYFAGKFVLFFLKNENLHPEADVRRFYHLYERA